MTKRYALAKKIERQQLFKRRLIFLTCVLVLAASAFYLFQPRGNNSTQTGADSTTGEPLTALQCAENFPTNVLVGQVLMVGLPANQMTAQAALFTHYHVGGAVLMTSPTNPSGETIKLFKSDGSPVPLLISTDEEGGLVQRFKSLGALPAPQTVASTKSISQAQRLVSRHAAKLKSVGVDMVLGPLADVAPTTSDGPLGSRVFSSDPDIVTQYDQAYINGWQAAGLLPTLKHFPGMGSATANTDFETATTPPLSSLKQRDFVPYKQFSSKAVAIMVGNQNVPGWFKGPASLSPVVNKYLRNTLGYSTNLIVTDSLAAVAITSQVSVPDAVVDAIAAGNDIVLLVGADSGAITTQSNRNYISQSEAKLKQAIKSGRISKQRLAEAVVRKLAAQNIQPCSVTSPD